MSRDVHCSHVTTLTGDCRIGKVTS
ncbi:hypothetical protein GGQ54_002710 [Naumannella cuiyingiana]|uniref:Uncharacterized protein n=1 Tax=Naumannella cuiyingiana TaxID=1347891 RepID=A0A7Z0DBA2_9ACTN|nr:hypothetical protein [Naumannella cuiyingiana]